MNEANISAPAVAPTETEADTPGRPAADTFTAYADGSSLGNPGPGGWAVVLIEGGDTDRPPHRRRLVIGSAQRATNNVMELEAATMTLTSLSPDDRGTVWSDSEYVVKGLNEWLPGWERRAWRTSAGKAVANVQHWRLLADLARDRPGVRFSWVRGHSGNPDNELADALARAEAEKVRSGLPTVSRLELGE